MYNYIIYNYYIYNYIDPTWASLNRGVLLCPDCCGVHRSLGRHISYIKSLHTTNWSPAVREVSTVYNQSIIIIIYCCCRWSVVWFVRVLIPFGNILYMIRQLQKLKSENLDIGIKYSMSINRPHPHSISCHIHTYHIIIVIILF